MTEQRFILPQVPPSVNNLYANVAGHGRVKTRAYRAWVEAAQWHIKAQFPRWQTGDLAVEIECRRTHRRRDIDNIGKASLDPLTGIVFADDSQIIDLRIRWADVEGVHITVRAA